MTKSLVRESEEILLKSLVGGRRSIDKVICQKVGKLEKRKVGKVFRKIGKYAENHDENGKKWHRRLAGRQVKKEIFEENKGDFSIHG